jgi:hypothetical protein
LLDVLRARGGWRDEQCQDYEFITEQSQASDG